MFCGGDRTMSKLEICCDSVQSAVAAEAGGAQRIELCANLLEGGTTPSGGVLSLCREAISIGLHVLIRPRGGDFCYDETELEVMRRDITFAKQNGVEGVVLGMLRPDGTIDCDGMRDLIALARPLRVTFHRAFDMTHDPLAALEDVISLGADYLLTSGQQATAFAGRDLIAKLVRQAADRIAIMPGAGVNEENILELARVTGAREFHSSGRRPLPSRMIFRRSQVTMGAWSEAEFSYSFVDEQRVKRMVAQLAAHD